MNYEKVTMIIGLVVTFVWTIGNLYSFVHAGFIVNDRVQVTMLVVAGGFFGGTLAVKRRSGNGNGNGNG